MILCIDCGNTRIKWGLRGDSDQWIDCGALPTAKAGTLAAHLPPLSVTVTLIGCSVAAPRVASAIEASLGRSIQWLRAGNTAFGIKNDYRDPGQLGADRWAAMIGARHVHDGPLLVICAGTATTVDLIDSLGCFHGGLILPGLDLMRHSLVQGTAGLSVPAGSYVDVPNCTADAISAGAIHATLGAIERMAQRLTKLDGPPVRILSGGAAPVLRPHLPDPTHLRPTLILEGLALIATPPHERS